MIASNQQFQIELRIDSGVPCLLFPFPPRNEKCKAEKQTVDIMVQYENTINQKGFMKEEIGNLLINAFISDGDKKPRQRGKGLTKRSKEKCGKNNALISDGDKKQREMQ